MKLHVNVHASCSLRHYCQLEGGPAGVIEEAKKIEEGTCSRTAGAGGNEGS